MQGHGHLEPVTGFARERKLLERKGTCSHLHLPLPRPLLVLIATFQWQVCSKSNNNSLLAPETLHFRFPAARICFSFSSTKPRCCASHCCWTSGRSVSIKEFLDAESPQQHTTPIFDWRADTFEANFMLSSTLTTTSSRKGDFLQLSNYIYWTQSSEPAILMHAIPPRPQSSFRSLYASGLRKRLTWLATKVWVIIGYIWEDTMRERLW